MVVCNLEVHLTLFFHYCIFVLIATSLKIDQQTKCLRFFIYYYTIFLFIYLFYFFFFHFFFIQVCFSAGRLILLDFCECEDICGKLNVPFLYDPSCCVGHKT